MPLRQEGSCQSSRQARLSAALSIFVTSVSSGWIVLAYPFLATRSGRKNFVSKSTLRTDKTFLAMAGGDGTDAGGPAPLDSLDQSGYLLGRQTSSARTVIVHDHYCAKCLPSESTDHANLTVSPTSEFNESLFQSPSTVTLETFYSGGGCHEHFGDHFWLKTADLKAIGLPSEGSNVGALTMNGMAINIAHMGPSQAGSGCVGCCSGCLLTIFQIRPFNIGSLNLHPGSNVTISFSTTPVPPPPPPPPSPLATGAIRVGDWKLLIGPQHDATWFGMFSPNASFNATAAGATACEIRPCLFNIAVSTTACPLIVARSRSCFVTPTLSSLPLRWVCRGIRTNMKT